MRISRNLSFFAVVVGLLAALPGCTNNADTPTADDYDTIAKGVAPLLSADFSAQGRIDASVEIATGDIPLWLSLDSSGSLSGQQGGLMWNVNLECYDAEDRELTACGSATDRASFAADFDGDLRLGTWSGELTTEADWNLDGLAGTSAIELDGRTYVEAHTEFTGFLSGTVHRYDLAVEATVDLTRPASGGRVSGEARLSIDARRTVDGVRRDSDAHFVVDGRLVLDGTGDAILTLDGGATYRLDVDTGNVQRM